MSDLHKAMDSDIYRSVKTTIIETQDEFIWRTVYPFCENELKASLSKEDLKLALTLLRYHNGMWISVKDKMPEFKQKVIACVEADYGWGIERNIGICELYNDDGFTNWYEDDLFGQSCIMGDRETVTHWMPLPPLPKEEQECTKA